LALIHTLILLIFAYNLTVISRVLLILGSISDIIWISVIVVGCGCDRFITIVFTILRVIMQTLWWSVLNLGIACFLFGWALCLILVLSTIFIENLSRTLTSIANLSIIRLLKSTGWNLITSWTDFLFWRTIVDWA
jgi:hypothetical protein